MAIKTSDLNARLFGKTNKRVATTVQEAQQAAKEQAHVIELSVAGEEMVEFKLTRIEADQVESQTVVFADNAREQSFLNEHALSDVLITLRERGQQYPAVGRMRADGKIEVLDGSRRRMSCILAGKLSWFMSRKISMLSMLSFYPMLRMRINHFLFTRKVKRCKQS